MRKAVITLIAVAITAFSAQAVDFTAADREFDLAADFPKCRKMLLDLLPQAAGDSERAEVYWRLARVQVVIGEAQTTRDGKRAEFGKGLEYASKAIAADPLNHWGYMWHSANVGRECQTHSLIEQARSVPAMMKDLDTILKDLGRTECAPAWQALAEIYYNHPFKSNGEALEYARKAVENIPAGEIWLTTKTLLARILYDLGGKFKDEAKAVAAAARAEYEASSKRTPYSEKEYAALLELIKSFK